MAIQTGTLLLTHDDTQILVAMPMQFPVSMTNDVRTSMMYFNY